MESQEKYWNIDPASGALLQALLYTHKPKFILEVGTSNGYSAIRMGKIAKTYGGHIQTIEFFAERVKLARENITKEDLQDTIEVLQGDAIEILQKLVASSQLTPVIPAPEPESTWMPDQVRHDKIVFDFIFLDASKKEYAAYFQYAMQSIAPGGIIVADNTISHRNKLSEFFEAVKKEPRANALELEIGTGLMIVTVPPQYP